MLGDIYMAMLALVSLLALASVHGVRGDCAVDIGITPAFLACMADYTTFQARMSEEGLLAQGSITPLLCSDDSKRTIKCMMAYSFQCPDLITNKASTRKLLKEFETTCLPKCTTDLSTSSNFHVTLKMYKTLTEEIANRTGEDGTGMCRDENIQVMVSLAYYLYECPTLQMYIGGSNTTQELSKRLFSQCSLETDLPSPKPKTCPSALRCVLLLFSDYVQVFFAEVKTPYRKLQKQIGFFCGKTGDAFKECLRESLPEHGSCAVTVPITRSPLNRVFSMSDQRNESVNGFLERECLAFPEDFADNICISRKLESDDFIQCLNELKPRGQPSYDNTSCEYYHSSLRCLQSHVTDRCGRHYLAAFQRGMAIFLTDMTSPECLILESPDIGPSSSSFTLQIQWSSYCYLLMSVLLLQHWYY